MLFKIDTLDIMQKEFSEYIMLQQRRNYKKQNIETLVNLMFNQFVNQKILNYEESILEKKYPEFKALIQEYHDGILLFELTDQLVWSKAVEDTIGLENFYTKNINNYMWGNRVDATIVTCESKIIANKAKQYINRGKSEDWITKKLGKSNPLAITFTRNIYSKNDNQTIDSTINFMSKKDNHDVLVKSTGDIILSDNKFKFVYINKFLQPQPKKINEARGIITSDYQNYLEKKWVKELREKYIFKVNYDVLLNNHIGDKKKETPSKNTFVNNSSKKLLTPTYYGTFNSAFKQARLDLGKGKSFYWNKKIYHTNYATEL